MDIQAEQRQILTHIKYLSSSDFYSSLLHSLGVQLGKERKLHSEEDLDICNYVCPSLLSLEQTLNFHRRTFLPYLWLRQLVGCLLTKKD